MKPALLALALTATGAGAGTLATSAAGVTTGETGETSATSATTLEPPSSSAVTSPPEPAWQASFERSLTTIARDVPGPWSRPAPDAPNTPNTPDTRDARPPELPADYLVEAHGWLRLAYHPSQSEAAARVTSLLTSTRERLASRLGQRVLERVELRLARTPGELVALAPRAAPPPPGGDVAVYPALHLVALSVQGDGDGAGLEARARHALAHVALHDAVDGRALPRWLDEGFAIEAADERGFARGATLLRAQLEGTTLTLAQLDAFPDEPSTVALADAEAADMVRALGRDADRARFTALLGRVRAGEPFARALSATYGADLPTLEARWRDELGRRYLALPLATAGALGLAAVGAIAFLTWRRRRRTLEAELAEARQAAEAARQLAPDAAPGKAPKLIVVDEGRGHVVYLVPSRAVPKITHDGKTHTLH